MKIDKRNPAHWLSLAGFWLQAALGTALRPLLRSSNGTIVLYGHKLNGNLLALYRHMRANPSVGLRPVYLSMDLDYLRELRAQGVDCCWACGPACAALLARAEALVSDHGLHSLGSWRGEYQRLDMKFFDVWHGMSTMEYRPEDVSDRHRYDEIWVASELYQLVYTTRFGFDEGKVVMTGHARADRLIARTEDRDILRRQYGLPVDRRLILFAPTWKQQSRARSIYPFGCGKAEFLEGICRVALDHGASVVMRSHLNSSDAVAVEVEGLYLLPASRYADTEAILEMCDILVCDWSTIAFDWLLLNRPAIFLEVEPPYPLGAFLGDEFRYGEIVDAFPQLLQSLGRILGDPAEYWGRYGPRHQAAKDKFYGTMADGRATERCVNRLIEWIRA
ncbi:CDP-glycerol glycerophosphotransferase family protein [Pseudoxanthomonas sp.]|jgi:CDP-glycerol glycerophosphotransferase|uniref:CDP-glycerol glycerophosphotransferase family protein n=1 Tax=Pseudoxanthomonas sp. TaxID=1871049 RepID=UPI002E13FCED|nr:CDP-glycerol glycerophosphotransferase family protein [Pseudoxanthomonas sp.]